MPVQINEVIIRTVIDAQSQEPRGRQDAGSPSEDAGRWQEELLERVLEIMQESKER